MVKYCERCRDFHDENDMCPKYKELLKKHPEWLSEAADFVNVAAQQQLVATQSLDQVCQTVNKLAGTNLSFEGSQQVMRDVQVFQKLNSDSFSRTGQFANAQAAQETFNNASEGFKRYLKGRLNGTGEEIDWFRQQKGKISSLLNKSTLPDGNIPGYDGETVNRFTGKVIERTSVKAAEGSSGLYTNAKDIVEAIEKGTLKPDDSVFGVKGTGNAVKKAFDKAINHASENGDTELVKKLKQAKDNLKITERNTTESVKKSTERLTEKIEQGEANIYVTTDQIAKQAAKGAIIGAIVGLTISSLMNYIGYKNGEITRDEAFKNIGEDGLRSAIVGGAMGAITIFLPAGALGFVAGVAIGMYINEATKNLLDEVFGKGAYEQILNASGYIAGTARNLVDMLEKYKESVLSIDKSNKESLKTLSRISALEEDNHKKLAELGNILEDL